MYGDFCLAHLLRRKVLPTAAQYAFIVCSAQFCQLNCAALSSPLDLNRCRSSSFCRTLTMASHKASLSVGATISPAPATTSGSAEALELMTDVPQAIASRAGKPTPTYSDGYT